MPRARAVLAGAAYAALAVADSVAAGKSVDSTAARRSRYLLKPALMPALTVAFLGTRPAGARADTDLLRTGTVLAQAMSWGGDVALLGRSERSFLTGVGSFFGAHVAYAAAFLSVRGDRSDYDNAGLKVALGLWLTLTPVISSAAGRKEPALRIPVAVYATVLSGMFATSRMLDPALPRGPRRTLQAGTALFLLSDTVLAVQKFVLKEPRPLLESVVMSTYTAGQGLIAAGVAGRRVRLAWRIHVWSCVAEPAWVTSRVIPTGSPAYRWWHPKSVRHHALVIHPVSGSRPVLLRLAHGQLAQRSVAVWTYCCWSEGIGCQLGTRSLTSRSRRLTRTFAWRGSSECWSSGRSRRSRAMAGAA